MKKQREERESLRLIETLPGLSFRQVEIPKDFIKHPYRPFTARAVAGTFPVSLPRRDTISRNSHSWGRSGR